MGLLKKVILGIGVSIALIATFYANISFANTGKSDELKVQHKVKKYQLFSELAIKEDKLIREYLYERNPASDKKINRDTYSSYIYLVNENDELIFEGDSRKIGHLLEESAFITSYNDYSILLYLD